MKIQKMYYKSLIDGSEELPSVVQTILEAEPDNEIWHSYYIIFKRVEVGEND